MGGDSDDVEYVSSLVPLAELRNFDFAGHDLYTAQADDLIASGWRWVRKVRGDGSCFYRGYIFQLLERAALKKESEPGNVPSLADLKVKLETGNELALKAGYGQAAIEDFFEDIIGCITKLQETPYEERAALLEAWFKKSTPDSHLPDSLVVYCRTLTSTYLKIHAAEWEPFIEGKRSMDQFCKEEVDPMWHEAEQMQVQALTSILNAPVGIHCLFGAPETRAKKSSYIVLPHDAGDPVVHLLFKPGHYDILYGRPHCMPPDTALRELQKDRVYT